MRLPTLVPTTRSTGIRSCSSTRITPMWAKPRAAPPPRTSATFGSGPGVAAAGGACGGGAVGSGGVAVRQAARRRTARAKARRIEAPWRSPSVTAGRPGSRRAAEISRKIDRLPPISHRRRNMPQVIQSMKLAQVLAEAADIAASVSQKLTSAHQLLSSCGLQLPTLRNVALSYFTSRMPRRLKELQPVKVGPSPQQAATGRRGASRPPVSAEAAEASAESLRALDAQLEQAMEELEAAAGIDGEAPPTPAAPAASAAPAPSPRPSPPLRGGEGGSATPSSTSTPASTRAAAAAAAAMRARRSPHSLDP